MDKFKGVIHHSSFWPEEKVEVKGKRCAVIGTGATGVQIVQAWGPEAEEVKVFQRTPNLAVPMRKRPLTVEEQERNKKFYPELFGYREKNFGGFLYDWAEKNTFDDTPEEREQFYNKVWAEGGFRYWVALYKDNLMNADANRESYKFWAKKTRDRIGDPRLRDLLAPLEMPHYFGVKRPCLEYNYYEQFNRPSVDLVDIKENPIKEFTETGITLQDGTHHEFDVVAVATGFVSPIVTSVLKAVSLSCTNSLPPDTGYCNRRYVAFQALCQLTILVLTDSIVMTQLGLKSLNNTALQEEWTSGATTYLGLTVSGYPNMFHIYGVHGPTLLSNGPSTVEVQGRWIADAIDKMEKQNIKYINAKPEAAKEWKQHILDLNNRSLFPTVKSTYMGGSVPDKVFEPVCYSGGIPTYKVEIRQALDDMSGFEVVKAPSK